MTFRCHGIWSSLVVQRPHLENSQAYRGSDQWLRNPLCPASLHLSNSRDQSGSLKPLLQMPWHLMSLVWCGPVWRGSQPLPWMAFIHGFVVALWWDQPRWSASNDLALYWVSVICWRAGKVFCVVTQVAALHILCYIVAHAQPPEVAATGPLSSISWSDLWLGSHAGWKWCHVWVDIWGT